MQTPFSAGRGRLTRKKSLAVVWALLLAILDGTCELTIPGGALCTIRALSWWKYFGSFCCTTPHEVSYHRWIHQTYTTSQLSHYLWWKFPKQVCRISLRNKAISIQLTNSILIPETTISKIRVMASPISIAYKILAWDWSRELLLHLIFSYY